jgi:hypothetical protein
MMSPAADTASGREKEKSPASLEEQVVFGHDMDMSSSKSLVLIGHAFVGWVLCAATMGVSMFVTSLDRALVVHAVAAPIFFAAISAVYFRKFHYTTPIQTALAFVAFIMTMDFFVVALLINRNLGMFASLLGTWIPFVEIFFSTLLTGLCVVRHRR